jgi:hypothetical protein
LNLANFAQSLNVSSSAKFQTVLARADHTNDITIFVPKEHHRTHRFSFQLRGLNNLYRTISDYVLIGHRQDAICLFWGEALAMGKVEAQSVGANVRALLTHVISEDNTQPRV